MHLLTDSHSHLDHFPPEEIAGVLDRARSAGLGMIICAGTTLDSSIACINLSKQYKILFAGVGIHPMNLQTVLTGSTYKTMEALVYSNPKVVCISEVGLDFLPQSPNHEIQYQAFRRQIGLAREMRKPIIFHSRASERQVLRTLEEEKASDVGGVMHYFEASLDIALEAINLGFLISLAKPFLRLEVLQQVVREIPLENIVLETDSAPQPWKKYRKNWTEPEQVRLIAQKLAEIKDLSLNEVIYETTSNLTRLLKVNATDADRIPME